jgi:hypothetical protein
MLRGAGNPRRTPAMMRFFDIGDRARLPWRFHRGVLEPAPRA